jgi:hypothetical protein
VYVSILGMFYVVGKLSLLCHFLTFSISHVKFNTCRLWCLNRRLGIFPWLELVEISFVCFVCLFYHTFRATGAALASVPDTINCSRLITEYSRICFADFR